MAGHQFADERTRIATPRPVRRGAFATRLVFPEEPEWRPLERVARLSHQTDGLPSFHEVEFMYMAAVWNAERGLQIHLYKHRDTRCYLNLDNAGHAYEYCGSLPDGEDDSDFGGYYRLCRSLAAAVARADLWIFDRDPAFVRSRPPGTW